MTSVVQEIVNSAKNLSIDDRHTLIDAIMVLNEPPIPDLIGDDFLAELKRRSEAIDRGESQGIPFEEVIRQAHARHGMPSDE